MFDDTIVRTGWITALYLFNILAAGVPGGLVFFAPRLADKYLFSSPQGPAAASILGSVWLAAAGLSALGLFFPARFAGLFALQLVYKLLWLVAGAPRLARSGHLGTAERYIAATFAVEVALLLLAAPWGFLLSR